MIKLQTLLEAKSKYKIYCDMDGVLVDFEAGFMKLSKGKHPDSLRKNIFWAMFYSLTKGKEKEYWASLPWTKDGKILWNFISKYDTELLTAPPSTAAQLGKKEWVNNNLGSVKVNFKQARDKHHFVKPNAILIDDKESTIDTWNEKGGIGIYYSSASDVINRLKELGL